MTASSQLGSTYWKQRPLGDNDSVEQNKLSGFGWAPIADAEGDKGGLGRRSRIWLEEIIIKALTAVAPHDQAID